MRSSARETSSVMCSALSPFTISLIFGKGPRSLRAMASLRVTAFPITFRFAPQTRQYCIDCDSVPHWGQYISTSKRAVSCFGSVLLVTQGVDRILASGTQGRIQGADAAAQKAN